MAEFDVNKRYVFHLDTALKDDIFKNNYNPTAYWIDYCQGKEVTVIDEIEGRIVSPEKIYFIMPQWCKEIT